MHGTPDAKSHSAADSWVALMNAHRQTSPSVCIVAKYTYPGCTRLRQQVAALEQARLNVDILCLRAPGQAKTEVHGSVTVYRVAGLREKDSFLKYIFSIAVFSLAAFVKLQMLSLRKKYDVIVFHTLPESLIILGAIQALRGSRLVLDVRDVSLELYQSKWGKTRLKRLLPLVRLAEKISCRLATRILCASPGFRDRLVSRGTPRDKSTLMYNTADIDIFPYWTGREFNRISTGARIFYHGTVAERFGVEVAVEAMHYLRELVPDSVLDVYGPYDTDYREAVEARITALGLDSAARFHDPVSLEEINTLFRKADIAVVPYLDDDFMNLAFSTKTFECAAAGLPVVASRLRPAQLVFPEDSVLYAQPGNPRDFADKMAQACSDPELRRSMSERAHKAYLQVCSTVMAERFVETIEELLPSR